MDNEVEKPVSGMAHYSQLDVRHMVISHYKISLSVCLSLVHDKWNQILNNRDSREENHVMLQLYDNDLEIYVQTSNY